MADFYKSIDEIAVFLYITTWMGTSIGAQHYYGKMKYKVFDGGFDEDLSIRLTQRAAIEHNKGLRRLGRPSSEFVKAGELTTNFMDKETVRETGIACFKKGKLRDHWDEKFITIPSTVKFLVEGDHGLAQPQRILACKPGLESAMDQLNELFDAGNGWDWDHDSHKRLDKISSDWYRVMATLGAK